MIESVHHHDSLDSLDSSIRLLFLWVTSVLIN